MPEQSTSAVPEAPQASRRAVLMGLAAAATPMAPAIANALSESAPAVAKAGDVDPIFAAIERERAAYAAYESTRATQEEISDQNPFPAPKRDRRAEKKRLASPKHQAWWARYKETEEAHTKSAQALWGARETFLQTPPSSVAGLIAFIDHIEGPFSTGGPGEAFWDEEEHRLAFPTLATAARNLIARGRA
jgi:hypothetical protein